MPDDDYYSQQRPDVVSMIDRFKGARFLDIGCGAGGIGSGLRQRGAAHITGVELNAGMAAKAALHYDRVLVGGIEKLLPGLENGFFDCVICADILEHLADPWEVINDVYTLVRPGGIVVASIPNVRFARVLAKLLRGDFEYEEWGVMDRTHLRFFTLRSIRSLFANAGFLVEAITSNMVKDSDKILETWKSFGVAQMLARLHAAMGTTPFEPSDQDLMEMMVYQFIVRARKKDDGMGRV